jgi:ribosomal protein S11
MADRKIDLTVTLVLGADAAAAAKRLQAAGLEVSDVFDAISVIQGRAPASARRKLSKVPGVTDVAPTPVSGVGPPDAEIS